MQISIFQLLLLLFTSSFKLDKSKKFLFGKGLNKIQIMGFVFDMVAKILG